MKLSKRKICTAVTIALGLMATTTYSYADANVPCTDGTTITGTTVFGGGWSPTNTCGNNISITTTGNNNWQGNNETNNTNGIYYAMNGIQTPFIFGDNLTVTVTGNNVNAVRTNGSSGSDGPHIISIGNSATLIATGTSSDVINVAQSPNGGSGYGKVLVGHNATIRSDKGTAIRVNLTSNENAYNLGYIGEDANIMTGANGSNSSDTVGYAVFAGNRDNVLTNGTAKGTNAVAVIGARASISTSGNNAYAVYANKGGVIQLQGTSDDPLGVTTIQTSGQGSDALRAEKKITSGNNHNALGGTIELTGDATIVADSSFANTYALHTLGEGSQIVSQQTNYHIGIDNKLYEGNTTGNNLNPINIDDKATTLRSGKLNIKGDMLAESGLISLRMTDGSKFYGNTSLLEYTYSDGSGGSLTDPLGQINLQISGANSQWQMSLDSYLTTLELDSSHVYIGDQSIAITDNNKVTLSMNTLSGSGTFHIRTDIQETGLQSANISDLIKVTGSASGNHYLMVQDNNTGGANVTGSEIVRVAEIASGNENFALANTNGYVDMGAYKYYLNKDVAGTDAHNWYLSGTTPIDPPIIPPVINPPSVSNDGGIITNTANHSVNIFNINYLLNNAEMHTLLQRMGELRGSNGLGGTWARVYGGKFNSFSSQLQNFDFKYSSIQLGVDRMLNNQYGRFYIGGMVGYSSGEAKYRVGSGDVKSYHLGLYTTFKHSNGFYVDGLVKYVHMNNKFTTQTGGGYTINGKGSTKGFSVSIESGKRFYFQPKDNGWYIEPQAQLTYSHQDSTTVRSSNHLKTRLDSVNSLLGRMSVIVGYKITDGTNPIDVYFKTGYVKEFKGKTGYTFNNSGHNKYKLNGNWWDNAIGANIQFNKKHNLYFDVNYSMGNKFNKAQLNLGYRYEF